MWCNGESQNYFLGPVGTSQETGDDIIIIIIVSFTANIDNET